MFEERCSVTPEISTHYEAATHGPIQVSREAPFNDATHHAQDSVISGSMQHNQCPLGTAEN
jgi:N-acetyl-anhydromuramyl-L-alanine amidase AmpD